MSRPPLRPGMRRTRQRQQVWEAVHRLGGHCTADEITAELQREQPGALHAVRLGEGPIHYEVAAEDHQHALCQVCQGILHIEHGLVAELERHLEERHRFRPLRTDVVVIGICDACARGFGRTPRRRTLGHVHYD